MPPPAHHQDVGAAGLLDQHLNRVPVDDLAVDIGAGPIRGRLADRLPEDGHLVALDLLGHGLRGVTHRRLGRCGGVMPGQHRPDRRPRRCAVPDGPAQRRHRLVPTVHAHHRGRPRVAFARHASCLLTERPGPGYPPG